MALQGGALPKSRKADVLAGCLTVKFCPGNLCGAGLREDEAGVIAKPA